MGLQINNLCKGFDVVNGQMKYVLNNINLKIETGQFICILGKSGSGKSTLLNLLAGYLKADLGNITVDDVIVDGPDADRGVVFQHHALFPWFTVEENIGFGPKVAGQSKEEIKKLTDYYIDLVGLDGYAEKYPNSLSGGMAQRVGIARALANDPKVLLMDEPLGALDALTRDNMRKELERIWSATKKTVVFITHSVPEAVYLADRVIVLKEGQVDMDLKIDLPRPRDAGDAKFVSYVTKLEEKLTDGAITEMINE
ncbi:MAG: ABC transporter ATP-binding protein [Eubacteriales bacterium]|nr:ABC transporter ATP-binding protein [Eubacteriales bacterium]